MNIQERRGKNGGIVSYRIRVFDHRDQLTGKQIFRTLSVKYDNKKSEAWNKKNAEKQGIIFEQKLNEQSISCSNINLHEYCEYAISVKKRNGLSPATIYSYNNCLHRLTPYLGHIKLRLLSPSVINRAYCLMEDRGISKSSIYQTHLFLHSVLAMAFKEGLIPRNYADAASPPRRKRKDVTALTEEDITAFFTALYTEEKHYVYQVLFTVLLASGCRIGELCALSWDNVDFAEKRIHICRHFTSDDTGPVIIEGSKTHAGDRWIYMDDATMELLKDLKEYYLLNSEKNSKTWDHRSNAVFFSVKKRGAFIQPPAARRWLRIFTEKHGLKNVHPHLFRHTAISLQLAAGISIADAAKRAGHSRPDVTLRIYSHVIKDNDTRCCEAVTDKIPKMPEKRHDS